MKKNLFYLLSIFAFTTSIIGMDVDDESDEEKESHSLAEVIVEKAGTLKKAYSTGIIPHGNTLNCSAQKLISLDDLAELRDDWHLNNLTNIDFSNNKLETLPKILFSECPNLKKFNGAYNNISECASDLPHHQNLTVLYLHNNKFKGTFPLAYILNRAPLEKLTLHNNQITHYGIMTNCLALKQLCIDPSTPDDQKQIIAASCKNLVAEFCDGSTHVQNQHSYTKYSDHFQKAALFGAIKGVGAMSVIGFGTGMALSIIYDPSLILAGLLGGVGIGIVVGPLGGAGIGIACMKKSDPKYDNVPTRKIKKYPPMLDDIKEPDTEDKKSSDENIASKSHLAEAASEHTPTEDATEHSSRSTASKKDDSKKSENNQSSEHEES